MTCGPVLGGLRPSLDLTQTTSTVDAAGAAVGLSLGSICTQQCCVCTIWSWLGLSA